MKKFVVLSLVMFAAVACSKGGGGGGNNGNFKDSEIVRAFKQAGGHAPSRAELTANGWCEMVEEGAGEYENLVFRNDGTMKFVIGNTNTGATQTAEGTYTLSGAKITATIQGQSASVQAMVASKDGDTALLLQTEEGKQIPYIACGQE